MGVGGRVINGLEGRKGTSGDEIRGCVNTRRGQSR